MGIRKKLLYQFIGLVALILFLFSLSVYLSFSKASKEDFYDRLGSKAKLVAQMLIDIEEIDADLLKRIEKNNPLSLPNEKIIIYDYHDNIVYSTDDDRVLGFPHNVIAEVRLKENIRLKQKSYDILGQFYVGKYDRYVVFAAATDIFGKGKLYRLRVILLIIFLISLFIVFLSGRIFVSRALTPIANITSQVNAIGILNLNSRISEGDDKDDLALLGQTFNKMLERLEIAFRTQKSFIANASHELRTPLTVITGQLEVILMKARTNEQYHKTILSVLGNIKNLNLLSNRLLLLAQASSEFSETDFSLVRIDEILWQARKDILKIHNNYKINIHFSELIDDENKLMVRGNEQLLRSALSNVFDNGCKYSGDHLSEVSVSYDQKHVIMIFSDQGIGIPESDLQMIFQPFYRASNVLETKGHGIGLSLVEKIVTLHKGKISVESELMKGSRFTISIPLQN